MNKNVKRQKYSQYLSRSSLNRHILERI